MKKPVVFFLLMIFFQQASFSQEITTEQLEQLAGKWTGSLTYTDYSDDLSRFKLPTEMKAAWKESKLVLNFAYTEPGGEIVTSKQTIKLSNNQNEFYMNGTWTIGEYCETKSGWALKINKTGRDNNKPSRIEQWIDYSGQELTVKKMVKYDGAEEFIERNTYELTRTE